MPIRTTHRSKTGKKFYGERNKKGQFTDIQTYKRAHGQDVKRKSKRKSSQRAVTSKSDRKTDNTSIWLKEKSIQS